ncbi:Uncharacterised protein [Enterobacter cloacae]|nr:Uncharacterised protein [Enterobacter cloacae]
MRRFTATGNHLHCFDTGGRDQRFKLLEVFHIFVLRKIDVYQHRLLTGELIERLNLTLQLNTIHQINRNWNTLPTQCVQERIL